MPDEAQTVHVHHASPIRGYEDEAAPFAKRALLFDRGPVPETSSTVLREDNQLLMGAEAESIVELLRATLPGGTARRVFALMAVGIARDSGLVIAPAAMLPGIAENVVARAAFDTRYEEEIRAGDMTAWESFKGERTRELWLRTAKAVLKALT